MAGGNGILQSMAGPNSRNSISDAKRIDLGKHGAAECDLDPRLWERLPEALTDRIAAKLPISNLLRLGSVCKSWRNVRSSVLSSDIAPRAGRLFFMSHGELVVFEIESRRGQSEILPLQFLRKQFRLQEVAASAGGLLCFRTCNGGEFIVCNPLAQCYKRVQMPNPHATEFYNWESNTRPFTPEPVLVGMMVDSNTGVFKLIVAAIPGSVGTTLIYDSFLDTWEVCNTTGPSVPNIYPNSNAIACGGKLYFLFKRLGSHDAELFKYDVELQAWSCIPLPPHTWFICIRNIIEHNGKIFLVTSALALALFTQGTELVAFELQDGETTSWVRTNKLPLSGVGEGMLYGTCIDCLGQGDVMFLVRSKAYGRFEEVFGSPFRDEITSVKHSFHDSATNSDVFSNWEDYIGDSQFANCRIFTPSILPFK